MSALPSARKPARPRVDPEAYLRRDAGGYVHVVDHGVYRDEQVYRAELEHVFRRQWTYLGLEAEVPRPGSYVTTRAGEVPVVVVRDEEGGLHAYENVCLHRGAVLVRKPYGEAKTLDCLYHRWSYSLTGRLLGVPMPDKFPASFRREEYRLSELPRVETHAGMIFASCDPGIEPLASYLGEMGGFLDHMLDGGRVAVIGYQRYRVKSNWKLFVENTVDGYHPALLHTMFMPDTSYDYRIAQGYNRAFRNGHGMLQWPITETPESRWDEERHMPIAVRRTTRRGDWDYSVSVFPNVMVLQVSDILAIRQLVPRGVDEVEVIACNLALESDSEAVRRHRAWVVTGQFGAAGVASIDDKLAMEAVQAGAEARYSDTLLLRGSVSEPVGELTTETGLRGFYEKWARCLAG